MDAENAAAIRAAYGWGVASHKPVPLPDNKIGVMVPEGSKLEVVKSDIPYLNDAFVKQSVVVLDTDSFCTYVNRFKDPCTQIFALPGFAAGGQAILHGVLDYHGSMDVEGGAGYCVHHVRYQPRYSDQWKLWSQTLKLSQIEFCEFIEENRADIESPAAAQLLDLVRTFKAKKSTAYNSVVYNSNGDVTLGYEEKTDAGQSTAMPQELVLGIPVFFRGERFKAKILVRYRVGNGGVQFELKPDRFDIIEDEAFSDIVKVVADRTTVVPYLGKVV